MLSRGLFSVKSRIVLPGEYSSLVLFVWILHSIMLSRGLFSVKSRIVLPGEYSSLVLFVWILHSIMLSREILLREEQNRSSW